MYDKLLPLLAVLLFSCAPSQQQSSSTDSAPPDARNPDTGTAVCGIGATPLHKPTVVVDLRLRSGDRNRTPNEADISRIHAAKGTVLHRFNVALVRVRLDTGALRALVSPTGVADYATLVDDTTRKDVSAQIVYTRPITSQDIEALRKLNIKTSGIPARPNILYVTLADSTVPALKQMPGVDFVRARAMACDTWG